MRTTCGTILAAAGLSLTTNAAGIATDALVTVDVTNAVRAVKPMHAVKNGPTCNVIFGSVNFESGLGLLPEVSRLVFGVSDPGNRLRGSLVWHQPWGDGKFPVNGAENLKIVKFGKQ